MFNKGQFIVMFEAHILANSTLCNVSCHYQLINSKGLGGDLYLDMVVASGAMCRCPGEKSMHSGAAICVRRCLFPQLQ